MDNVKTFYIPEGNNALNNALPYINNNDMWNNPIWALVFLSVIGNGGYGFGNRNLGTNANTDFVASQLGQAVAGNANAISNLATQLNCTEGQIQNGISSVLSGINNLASNMNLSSQNVINAINSGNQTLASQLCECCCNMKQLVTQTNYENQIATLNQTNTLSSKIDSSLLAVTNAIANQTNMINDKFCELEKRELNSKIDALRETNTTLTNQISNYNQTANLQAYINSQLAPISGSINAISKEVDDIICKMPNTVAVPYNPVIPVSQCTATLLGLNGGILNNSLWS